jgi:[Skp1-protein]-hydroxyproline N-acetylglucosaminyltransferase
MLRIKGRMLRQRTAAPMPALFWAAGCSFSRRYSVYLLYWYKCTNTDAARRSSLLREVPYDPALKFLFFGEEMSMLARMWTSGLQRMLPYTHVC